MSLIAVVVCALSLWVMKISRKKLKNVLDELTNLFGVSIFTIRVFEQIIFSMKLMIFEELWHAIMMHTNVIILNRNLSSSNGAYVLQFTMQIILVIVHQFRSISTTLIDLFVLFELISLLHLIMVESNMTIHQLLFVKNY